MVHQPFAVGRFFLLTSRLDVCEIQSNLNGRSIAVQHTELLGLNVRVFKSVRFLSIHRGSSSVILGPLPRRNASLQKGDLMRTCWFRTALFAVATIGLSTPALPQASLSTAQLNGTVLDSSGRAVPKAQVGLRSVDTNQSYASTTNEDGFYVVPSLSPGRYDLTIAASGFAKYQQTGISLSVGQAATVNVTLKVASVGEVITVTTEVAPVETTRTEISQVIDTQQIADLPTVNRRFTDFALLTPGVATSRTALGTTFTEFEVTQISFGGMRSFSNEITVDGADFVNTISGVQRATPPQDSFRNSGS